MLLMADGNGAYSLAKAIQMGRGLETFDFYWFEEPLPQPDYAGYEILTDKLDIAIAAGEALGSRGAFKAVLMRHAMDIVQPDVSLCGGFAECLFISEMARLWGVPSVPHCWGGAVVVAATLQLLALLPDASWARTTETPMLELDTYENPFRDQLVTTPDASQRWLCHHTHWPRPGHRDRGGSDRTVSNWVRGGNPTPALPWKGREPSRDRNTYSVGPTSVPSLTRGGLGWGSLYST